MWLWTESTVLKMQQVFRAVYTLSVLCTAPSYGADVSEADECTSGFMSVDRMDDILDNEGDLFPGFPNNQAIFPEVNFTCSGSIQSWVFGAQWEGNTVSYTELQIWRPGSEDGVYSKVGNTTIMTEEPRTEHSLYQYSLSSPLTFQAGDVLGFYQPEPSRSQLTLIGEGEARGRQLGYYHYPTPSAASQLNISVRGDDRYQIFINAVTDPPDCGCGFMGVERMRLLLGLDSIAGPVFTERRQQITPDMRFTCDGMITKWIIGARWGSDDTLYPELQIWRNIGNDTYQKINGTFMEASMENSNRIYEYDDFSPIPVQTGDILGAFIPRTSMSRLSLFSEEMMNTPINYYLGTDSSVTESPYDMIDIQNMPSLRQLGNHPLVSVEIVRETTMLPRSLTIAPSQVTTTVAPSNSPPPSGNESSSQSSSAAGIGGGIAAAVVLLIAVLVILIAVVCVLRRRQRNKALELPHEKGDGLDNPVYSGEITEGSRVAMNTRQYHWTGPLDDLYEMPQKENGEGHALYDQPPENDAEYAEVSRKKVATEPTTTSPETYRKFDNPLYERN